MPNAVYGTLDKKHENVQLAGVLAGVTGTGAALSCVACTARTGQYIKTSIKRGAPKTGLTFQLVLSESGQARNGATKEKPDFSA